MCDSVNYVHQHFGWCIALQATLLFLLHVGVAARACVKCFRLEGNKKTLFSSILYQCGIQRLGRDPKQGHRNIRRVRAFTLEHVGLRTLDQWLMSGTSARSRWRDWLQLGPPMQKKKKSTFMEVWRACPSDHVFNHSDTLRRNNHVKGIVRHFRKHV